MTLLLGWVGDFSYPVSGDDWERGSQN